MSGVGREEHPAACSMQVALELGGLMRETEVRTRMDAFMRGLTEFLGANGCRLIGHIKGMLDAGVGGQLFFSVTAFGENPRYKGELDGEIGKAELSLNVIVYGIEEEPVSEAIREQLARQFAAYKEIEPE